MFDEINRAIAVSREARRQLGGYNQDLMIVEECAELIHAIMKRSRGRASNDEVNEEMADVLLTILGKMNPSACDYLRQKTERLESILETTDNA